MRWSTDDVRLRSKAAQRYQFDRLFDLARDGEADVALPVEVPPPPPAPTFSQAELESACERAFAEGRAAGLSAAREQTEDHIEASLAAVLAEIAGLLGAQAEMRTQAEHDIVAITSAIARKLLPALYARHGESEVEAMVSGLFASLRTVPMISVRIAPEIVTALAPRLEQAAAAHGLQGRITIAGDGDLAAGDCRLEWAGGGAFRDQRRLWHDIETALADAVGSGGAQPPALPHHAAGKGDDNG